MRVDEPLSQAELAELDDFLTSDAVPEDCMDVAMLDGFLTAVASGPTLVPPSEWLPIVWGASDEEPDFESLGQTERILGLLVRLYNQNARTLMEAPEQFAPLLPEWERDGEAYVSGEE